MRYALLVLTACSGPAGPTHTLPAPRPLAAEPHVPRVQAPLGPTLDTPAFVPPPPAVRQTARVPGRRAPCFANRDVLAAADVFHDLEQHSVYVGDTDAPPPAGRYGTCTIDNGQLRDARGTLVADLHCGITVYVPGIIDHEGFEVGANGKDVAATQPDGDPICWADGDHHARCWFQPTDDAVVEHAHYSFAFAMPENVPGEMGPVRGADARDIFAAHQVTHFTQRMWCH